ncbi:uncharacterized protein LOC132209405 [Stegostoma tigrinum]|uniref:uncharacterized protein LOC132209405 n=1 Tax=Stegostoma tigrinum TaxID=3053191 RepID=UPI00286FC9F4|nr:uncharacterized protein LOC132209405 [Stegostoma tigrinum]XP_059500475.1 uncharacterized protein LOC132209405 [Stegostoma tigrinum]XP_059500476.1 uncharacterized protein LOC132209405 [Stegostoma tigrinum]
MKSMRAISLLKHFLYAINITTFIDNEKLRTCLRRLDLKQRFVNMNGAIYVPISGTHLKFTWTIYNTSVTFLDLSVSISGNHPETDIHFKPTDSHSYLEYTTSHPPSCKNSIPYSQFLHLRLICSQDEAFHSRTRQMSSFFNDRNPPPPTQPHTVVKNHVSHISCNSSLTPHPRNKHQKRTPSSSHTTLPTSGYNASSSNTSTICNLTSPPKTFFHPHPCLLSGETTLSMTPLSAPRFPPTPPHPTFSLQLQEVLHVPPYLLPHPHPRPQEDFPHQADVQLHIYQCGILHPLYPLWTPQHRGNQGET